MWPDLLRGKAPGAALAIVLAAAVAPGCACLTGLAISIGTHWDPDAPFSALSTWDWLPPPPASDDDSDGSPPPGADEAVHAAVAAELAARGYPRAAGEKPSFFVQPLASVEDVVAEDARFYYSQVPPWMRDALRDTHAIEGRRGVLVVDLIDPATRLPFWRGVASGTVDEDASPAARAERLRRVVHRLLGRFPPPG